MCRHLGVPRTLDRRATDWPARVRRDEEGEECGPAGLEPILGARGSHMPFHLPGRHSRIVRVILSAVLDI